jgi:hypothetical protein
MHQIPSLLERPKLYYNVDGVGELGIGFMCLGWSLLGWLQLHTPGTSTWHQMHTFFIYVAVMLSIIHYGSRAIKNRITYRRTGFVDYRARDKYWVPIGLGAGVSALVSAGLFLALRRHWEISTLASLVVDLLLAAAYIRIARTVRWKWAVFGFLVAGALVIAALPAEVLEAFANHTSPAPAIPDRAIGAYWLTFVVYGVALMVSGGISFLLYLHHTQARAQEGQ